LINALKLDGYHVVGNSVGGYVAARLALEDGRVGKFVTTTSGTLAPKGSAESKHWGKSILRNCASTCRAWKTCAR
jgi:pimeloyl-ACP methyl ester carboxylesterase